MTSQRWAAQVDPLPIRAVDAIEGAEHPLHRAQKLEDAAVERRDIDYIRHCPQLSEDGVRSAGLHRDVFSVALVREEDAPTHLPPNLLRGAERRSAATIPRGESGKARP
jgi:hypothetical protein